MPPLLTLYWLQGSAHFPKDIASPLPCARLLWEELPTPVDEGLPAALVRYLSQTFCAFGQVAFVSDADLSQRQGDTADYSRQLRMPAIRSQPLTLVQTCAPSVAKLAFEIGAWHYAPCQVLFLLDAAAPALKLTAKQIQSCILRGVSDDLRQPLQGAGVQICITLGHDGAWLNVQALAPLALDTLKSNLQRNSQAAGIAFVDQPMLSDPTFMHPRETKND